MFRFIRRHWVAYLIGFVAAIVLGFGLSVFVGIKGSTSETQRIEEVNRAAGSSSE